LGAFFGAFGGVNLSSVASLCSQLKVNVVQVSTISPPQASHLELTHSLLFQLIAVPVLGVVLPILVFAALSVGFRLDDPIVTGSAAAAIIAALTLVIASRSIAFYPSINPTSYILPLCAMIYGLILCGILFLRIEYSSRLLLATFLATAMVRYAIAAWNGQVRKQVFIVIPAGRAVALRHFKQLRTHFLASPHLPMGCVNPIIADLHHDLAPEWERFLAEVSISGTPVYHYRQVYEAVTGKVQIEYLSENGFGGLFPNLAYSKLKRFIDILLVVILSPVLLSVTAVVAGLIRMDSPGPIFFRQKRMGYQGRIFDIIKFRTMTCASNGENAKEAITHDNDPRITKIGSFLRRTRIDELPQVLNILRGEMSWIGPRPEAISLSKNYETKIPFYRYRHIVRPGITGWAQVNQGHVVTIDDIYEKLQYDFYYIKNFSYWIDFLIFFRTIGVVFTGFGAK